MEALQGTILGIKMKYLPDWIKLRQKAAKNYKKLLKGLSIALPIKKPGQKDVFYVYVIKAKNREKLQAYLLKAGINTMIHYPIPVHLQSGYKKLGYKKGDLPKTELAVQEILSLPFWPEISLAEQKYVSQKIKDFYSNEQD